MRHRSQVEQELGIHDAPPPVKTGRPVSTAVKTSPALRSSVSFRLILTGYWWCPACGRVQEQERCASGEPHRVVWEPGLSGLS